MNGHFHSALLALFDKYRPNDAVGRTLRAMAKALDTSAAQLSRVINGKSALTHAFANQLAARFTNDTEARAAITAELERASAADRIDRPATGGALSLAAEVSMIKLRARLPRLKLGANAYGL